MDTERDISEVTRRLQPGDLFHAADHDWKTRSKRRWKGSCPWHESSSGTCFTVDPDTLEWHCFHCERGGGPLQYVAELERIGSGAGGSLKGKDFFRAWEALSRHAGCEGPPDSDSGTHREGGSRKSSDRRPLRNSNSREARPKTAKATAGGPSMSRDIPPRGQPTGPEAPAGNLDTPERELREALVRYRKALAESEKARAYVEGRGLSVETLRAYGCGFAPAGEWIGPGSGPRLVTPHTTPPGASAGRGEGPEGGRPRLVNLSGRYLGECAPKKRHRHIGGNPTALFNASAIAEGTGPLVFCEGPLDALSFIEAGWERAVALHNTGGVPWAALRDAADSLVFAFDADDTGREDAVERAREAVLRGYEAHVLPEQGQTYGGHSDPNDALQAGALSPFVEQIKAAATDGNPMDGADPEESHGAPGPAGPENNLMTGGDAGGAKEHTAADLVSYWNSSDIGVLGRWLWERGGVPEGPVGPEGSGVYADRELHEWIKAALEEGPAGTTRAERKRLRRVLWQLYAEHGPEEIREEELAYLTAPEGEPTPEDNAPPRAAGVWEGRPRDPYRLGRLPDTVETARTAAPTGNPHEGTPSGQRGIVIDSPYSEGFVYDLKTLPQWARTWNGDAWIVDDCFAAFAGDLCRRYFG